MIREIRSLQSSDQSRLRDDHKHDGGGKSFARFMKSSEGDDDATIDEVHKPTIRNTIPKTLPGHQALWGSFFEQLNDTAQNDRHTADPLFSWGETRENAKRHTALVRQSANLNGLDAVHMLNKKI